MDTLISFIFGLIDKLPKIRPSIELAEGNKIQEELSMIKEELEEDLLNRGSR